MSKSWVFSEYECVGAHRSKHSHDSLMFASRCLSISILLPEQIQKIMAVTGSKSSVQISPSKLTCHDLFSKHNMTAAKIAQERNIKEATVLGYLAEVGATGMNMDWVRLCTEAHLAPKGSMFISADDVNACIMEADLVIPDLGLSSFSNETIGTIRGKLQSNVREKFLSQESVHPGLAYSQIRIVISMIIAGLTSKDWNEFLLEPPY